MAITEFSGTPPSLNQSQPDFDTNNQAFVNYVTGLAPELNKFAAALNTFATTSTSSTSLAVSVGSKSLTVEAGKSFQIGMTVTLGYTTNGAIFMQGQVTAYNSTTGAMTVLVNFIQGSGTYAAWTVSLSNPVLANDWSETVAAHATTMAIWKSGAKVINGSGTATITDFPDAPQAGAMREIRFEAGTVLTDNANISVQGNANYRIQAGDVVYLTALTTTTFDAVIAKEDGTAVGAGSVLQVVQGTTSTPVTNSTAGFVATGLSASITPSSATSKILVIVNQQTYSIRTANTSGYGLRVLRDSTVIQAANSDNSDALVSIGGASGSTFGGVQSASVLDSPSTTSAVTYSVTARPNSTANSGSITHQYNNSVSSIILMEIAR